MRCEAAIRYYGRVPLTLADADGQELEPCACSQSLPAGYVRKARLLLSLADGQSYRDIQTSLRCSSAYISQWKKGLKSDGLAGLRGRHQGKKATVLTPTLEARILEKARQD